MNIDPAFLQQLQKIYAKLDDQQAIIYQALRRRVWTLESGWFNGRFHKTIGDRYIREAYPIPVISIIGLCDIEVHFDKVSVLAKLERDTALAKCFDSFVHYDFTAASGEDDHADLLRTRHDDSGNEEEHHRFRRFGDRI